MAICPDEVSDDATVEFCYRQTEDGAENEEAGMGEEQECLAGANGRDDDPQEGSELLPEREGEFRSIALLWMEGEEAGMRSRIRLRRECDGAGGGFVVGGKKGGTEYKDRGEEEEERLSGGRIALAEDLREDDHRAGLGRSCTPLHS